MLLQFLAVFIVCLIFLVIFVLILAKSRAPVYRPSRNEILTLLLDVLHERGDYATPWAAFIGMPIRHDPELEVIRQACLNIEFLAENRMKGVEFGAGLLRYNHQGIALLKEQKLALERLIANEPIVIQF